MPDVLVVPGAVAAAATDLSAVGSTVNAAHMAAAIPTTGVIPAAADEVSSAIANLFSQHAATYQSLAGKAQTYLGDFVEHLKTSASSFSAAEAANAASLGHPGAAAGSPGQSLNGLTGLWNAITNDLIFALNALQVLGSIGYVLASLALILSLLVVIFGILLVEVALKAMFGVSVLLPPIIAL